MTLTQLSADLVDGEGNLINFDCAYSCRSGILKVIDSIRSTHGENVRIVPISGASGGGGIFQRANPDSTDITVVGLKLEPTTEPLVTEVTEVSIAELELNEIRIDPNSWRIYAGAGVTLDQLNRSLGDHLGARYRVLGADLTSYTYAQVGATFMTGGMGPQRRYFSDSVIEIALFNGNSIEVIDGDEVQSYAATYGWSGIVTAVCCRYVELPEHEIAFALPVNNTSAELARLLSHFAPLSYLHVDHNQALNACNEDRLIFGIEHVTKKSMEPMFAQKIDNEITRRAQSLVTKCDASGADGLVFINGFSNQSLDDFLLSLVDDAEAEELSIAGTSLEHTEIFNDAELMRAVREAVPFAARTQAPVGAYIYKGHTDSNIRLNSKNVEHTMRKLWSANMYYVETVEAYFDDHCSTVRGQILVYGHLNPYGVDPHNRVTLACDNADVFDQVRTDLHGIRDSYVREVRKICLETDSLFVGGEKGACSESEMFESFNGPENAPLALKEKFQRQVTTIREAHPLFNWRALPPYGNSKAM